MFHGVTVIVQVAFQVGRIFCQVSKRIWCRIINGNGRVVLKCYGRQGRFHNLKSQYIEQLKRFLLHSPAQPDISNNRHLHMESLTFTTIYSTESNNIYQTQRRTIQILYLQRNPMGDTSTESNNTYQWQRRTIPAFIFTERSNGGSLDT